MHKSSADSNVTARKQYGYMKILNLIHVVAARAFYKWALTEINPMHPDLPKILLRQQELTDKANRMFA